MRNLTYLVFASWVLLSGTIAVADIDTRKLEDYSSPDTNGQNIYLNNKNINTGMLQHTTIYPDGNMEGINQLGEHWYYDKASNTYHNYTTGKICKGTGGPSSICNQ